ncbi:unannotated protein [freshwater metagenome]|uniref:Unannotated protein n=1 Tax=freshwater metagenome TaxID=449393 RepID=A0A6J7C2W6_9ZZZZ
MTREVYRALRQTTTGDICGQCDARVSQHSAAGRCGTVSDVNLHAWMMADFTAVRSKLFDTVIRLVPHDRWHEQVDGGGATLAGLLLHITRHQDLAVNAVIRNRPALFLINREPLGLSAAPLSVGLSESEDRQATASIDARALVEYVTAVFDQTAEWLAHLGDLVLDIEPHTELRLSSHAGLDRDELPWLYSMWEGKQLWWLVQWPVIAHGHAHVGEAISIRNRMGLSPF